MKYQLHSHFIYENVEVTEIVKCNLTILIFYRARRKEIKHK